MEYISILVLCGISILGLHKTTHEAGPPHRLTYRGKWLFGLIVANSLIAMIIVFVGNNNERRRVHDFQDQVATLKRDLGHAHDLARTATASSLDAQRESIKLREQLAQCERSHPVERTETVLDGKWRNGRILVRLRNYWANNIVTDVFDGAPFKEKDRNVTMRLVNVRSEDMVRLNLKIVEWSAMWGYRERSKTFVHGDTRLVEKNYRSGQYAFEVDNVDVATFKDIIKRNPDAGVELELAP